MTRIVIVGEIYNADLSIGGGPVYPPPGQPSHPWVPPTAGVAARLLGRRRASIPTRALPGAAPRLLGRRSPALPRPRPAAGLPATASPPTHPIRVPPSQAARRRRQSLRTSTRPPRSPKRSPAKYVVTVYIPKTMAWTTKSYPPR